MLGAQRPELHGIRVWPKAQHTTRPKLKRHDGVHNQKKTRIKEKMALKEKGDGEEKRED